MFLLLTKTCSSAFYYLYNIRHIRKYLSRESTEKLVHAFISSRLDYCNSLLYGIPEYKTMKLQRVTNASARLIYRAHKFGHITPLLAELHWLPVRARIHYKILLITFKILHGLSPKCLSDLISIQQPSSYHLRRNDISYLSISIFLFLIIFYPFNVNIFYDFDRKICKILVINCCCDALLNIL